MSSKLRFFGLSAISALAIAAGFTIYVAPDFAVSRPSEAASISDRHSDPAPKRLILAQAPPSGANIGGTGTASSLPGGASSLNETYKDWRVACAQQGTAKRCTLSQVQLHQNGQRVLAIELNPASGHTVAGTLVMPFGLALDSGVTFQIDEKPAMQPVRFGTCMPGGCLVAVSFDAPTLVALRAGMALKVKAVWRGRRAVVDLAARLCHGPRSRGGAVALRLAVRSRLTSIPIKRRPFEPRPVRGGTSTVLSRTDFAPVALSHQLVRHFRPRLALSWSRCLARVDHQTERLRCAISRTER